MTRLSTTLAALLIGFAAAFLVGGAGTPVADDAAPAAERPLRTSYELDDGSFQLIRDPVQHPVGFSWVRTDASGDLIETWVLFRENTADGWLYPGASNPNVTVKFAHQSGVTHSTLADFLQWCEDRYPAAMNVDKDVDFAVHHHKVTVE